MKRNVLLLALTALLAVALSACGALIPPQHFDNPVGLQGQKISVPVTGSTATSEPTALIPLATGNGSVSATFDDVDLSQIPIGISKYQIALGFEDTATVASSTLPKEVKLTNISLEIRVSDNKNGTVTFGNMDYDGSLTLTKTSGNEYTVSGSTNVDLGQIFIAALASNNLSSLLKIIGLNGTNTPNTATAILSFKTDNLPAGSSVTLTISKGQGTVYF
jgi:hypothetical protein